MVAKPFLVAAGLLAVGAACVASEEEYLPWQRVEIVCAERPETGKVMVHATLASNEYSAVTITAFGREHALNRGDLAKLRGFPLSSVQLTHEAGYPELGGHTVHLHLTRVRHEVGKPVTEIVTVSVSKGKGLAVSEPRRLVAIGGDQASIQRAVQMLVPAITHTNDATYARIILPWLKEHQMELPADKDGLLVVYQPWGLVSGAALYLPAKEGGALRVFNDSHREGTPVAWSDKEWESVRQTVADGKFFELPYRNDNLGMDGASVYVEARIDGQHHRICHWQPDSPVVQRLANLIGRQPNYYYQVNLELAAWQAVLREMKRGDKKALAKHCTERGYLSIVKGHRAEEISVTDLRSLGKAWSQWELRFTSQTAHIAEAKFGPEEKEHSVSFIRTADDWKLDQWLPGQ